MYKSLLVLLFVLGVVQSGLAQASLLIYPTRVTFDEKDRSQQVTLTNTSQTTNTYRLEWREKRALREGGYDDIAAEEAKDLPVSSNMIRFSPRQVTLKPGERQVVRLALRRPRNLEVGEYRSHLMFKALPPNEEEKEESSPSLNIRMVISFAIPVVVREGALDASLQLKSAEIVYNPATESGTVHASIKRDGPHSLWGNLSAFWTPAGSDEQVLIAKLGEYSLWAELEQINAKLIWAEAPFVPSDGTLHIRYDGVRDFHGTTYIDEKIPLSKSDIKVVTE
ncbi:fimbrial biogenesis chaperone [Lacimicrobium alkaliphilum]|uniref:Pili assembly chaperone N-terminal domain-containing protein n=1 Tax=Lacimicrobium alkaliphilum TaxID=1526571 RepID=A0ABQ1R4K7_9ALTE|nr:fimbria/pilus periplasmic chaperone [Lacimicrobium alkaliphilum]GGD55556.1 hypothetical protein GCM10011357_08960 [Lacimicrobium alkaliphilum]